MNLVITQLGNRNVCATYNNKRMIQVTSEEVDSMQAAIGNIYVAKVKNILRNINAAFVEICPGQLCFLQMGSLEKPIYADENLKADKPLQKEDEIIVQVIRDGNEVKRPAVTCTISITGRYLVLITKAGTSISNKIRSVSRRKELSQWLSSDLTDSLAGVEYGFIARTNSMNAEFDKVNCEKDGLEKMFHDIIKKGRSEKVFSCIYNAPAEYICAVRDGYSHELNRIVTDVPEIYDEIHKHMSEFYPEMLGILDFYDDKKYPLPALYGVEPGIEKALARKVWLNSGAYFVIDSTEACTVIDINSGRAISGKKSSEDTFFSINKEAAKEILLQLRLRNISGIILIDFIDMKSQAHNDELMNLLKTLAEDDPLKTVVVDITKLGLVELTRKKKYKSLYEQFM